MYMSILSLKHWTVQSLLIARGIRQDSHVSIELPPSWFVTGSANVSLLEEPPSMMWTFDLGCARQDVSYLHFTRILAQRPKETRDIAPLIIV